MPEENLENLILANETDEVIEVLHQHPLAPGVPESVGSDTDQEELETEAMAALPAAEKNVRLLLETQLTQLKSYDGQEMTPTRIRTREACLQKSWELLGKCWVYVGRVLRHGTYLRKC